MLRFLLHALRRPILISPFDGWLALPPIARTFLPDAPAEEAVTYNRGRKAMAITLLLFRTGRTANCLTRDIEAAATALGWASVSPQTRAAVRANLGVLCTDSRVYR
ncbi:hypothetical protein [Streptomyces sp. NPDC059928]|uniref:hypothetical protein n=1 Tax=unclassified Streptomyces TaxID=2593676 RepID=UPI0036615670